MCTCRERFECLENAREHLLTCRINEIKCFMCGLNKCLCEDYGLNPPSQ